MDNDMPNSQYLQSSKEMLDRIKKDNEERLAQIMEKVRSANPGLYYQAITPIDEEKFKEEFKEARKLHDKGVAGDTEAVNKAHGILKKLYMQSPMNRQVEAYLGSTTALLGRDAPDIMDKMKYAKKGLGMLDRAVLMSHDDLEIRGLRAHVCFNLPEMYFQRTKCAINDFKLIISRYEADGSCIDKGYYCQLLFKLGTAYNTLGLQKDAETAWKKLLSVTSDSKYRELAAKEGYVPQ